MRESDRLIFEYGSTGFVVPVSDLRNSRQKLGLFGAIARHGLLGLWSMVCQFQGHGNPYEKLQANKPITGLHQIRLPQMTKSSSIVPTLFAPR